MSGRDSHQLHRQRCARAAVRALEARHVLELSCPDQRVFAAAPCNRVRPTCALGQRGPDARIGETRGGPRTVLSLPWITSAGSLPLAAHHNRQSFDRGVEPLNRYLRTQARQEMERDGAVRCSTKRFVAIVQLQTIAGAGALNERYGETERSKRDVRNKALSCWIRQALCRSGCGGVQPSRGPTPDDGRPAPTP